MCRFASLCKTLFLCANWHFFQFFCQGEFRKQPKISHFVDFDWGKMHQNGLSGTYLGVWGMLNPMALVASLYNKQFMKNGNFRRHIVENGVQNHENGMEHMQQSSLYPIFTPTPYFITLYLDLSIQNAEKTIITQKVLITQRSNIVHCDWHTQKPICIDLQAFANTFSLCKLMGFFFSFFVRGSSGNSQKFHILLIFDWVKCIEISWMVHI